ncbi:MAG: hypothetical protein ACMVP2_02380 [Imperialibacter sp.]|uniref:hypothetical protein n=1 Tax=Imperialibacter sp. TaxID=2038411 RepID=UPI003A851DEC
MRKLLTCMILFTVSGVGYCQIINIESNVYYATYSMKYLRDVQAVFAWHNPIPLKSVSSFPAYFAYDFLSAYKVDDISQIGIWGSYRSTGARNSYVDYSGSYTTDFLVESVVIGPAYQGSIVTRPGIIKINLRVGYSWNSLDIVQTIKTQGSNESTKKSTPSASLPIIVGISYRKDIWKGYINTSLLYEYAKLDYPVTQSGALVDWSGLKIGLGVGVDFTKKPVDPSGSH